MVTRREWLGMTLGAGAALIIPPGLLQALQQGKLIQRAIPSTGEMIPVIGLGTSATFSQVARGEELSALKEVIKAFVESGGRVFDTAPGYGASEQVGGALAADLGVSSKLFWATKVNAAGRGGGSADPELVRAQLETSFTRLRVPKIDLIQVHNLADVPTHLAELKKLKAAGRIRYLGVTTTSDNQYGQLADIMRNEPLDFIGIDYAMDNRGVEDVILPLARERKIGVLVYLPFGRTSLFRRVEGAQLPSWAADFEAQTWAQYFLKFIVSHPAVTAVTPATTQVKHLADNIAGGVGKLPDQATRDKMISYFESVSARRG